MTDLIYLFNHIYKPCNSQIQKSTFSNRLIWPSRGRSMPDKTHPEKQSSNSKPPYNLEKITTDTPLKRISPFSYHNIRTNQNTKYSLKNKNLAFKKIQTLIRTYILVMICPKED